AALLPNGKLGVIVPFTTDYGKIRTLLGEAKPNKDRDIPILRNIKELKEAMDEAGKVDTRHIVFRLAHDDAKQDKDVSLFSLNALASFASFMQKTSSGEHLVVLLISGGFNSDPGRIYYDMLERAGFSEGLASNAAVSEPNSLPDNNFDFQQEVQKSIGRLNRFNITLYAINTRGTNTIGAGDLSLDFSFVDSEAGKDYQHTLGQIAEETGGVAFQNSNGFRVGFDQVFQDMDHQYLICYSAPEHKKSGEYHKIKLSAKGRTLICATARATWIS
ncbi:MAG TPA: VWA domain-containing protein, partial [Acidobacteriota bacterium]|nr:VWA domain-containing protein [Acidobacteriota bacterium]